MGYDRGERDESRKKTHDDSGDCLERPKQRVARDLFELHIQL
jgi:hypothetical protein